MGAVGSGYRTTQVCEAHHRRAMELGWVER
jgi:hypothetical protein